MTCPDDLKALYIRELEQRRPEGNFINLTPRKGKILERREPFARIEGDKEDTTLMAWYTFHETACHRTYRDFYSKIFYCRDLFDRDIAPDTFLELIADREFLFLEYGELYANGDYPPLSFLVSALDAEEKNYSRENCDTVLNQAFVPTEANYEDFRSWQGNLRELKSARDQRIWQMKNLAVIPEPFTIPIDKSLSYPLTGVEVYLSDLFAAYLDICRKASSQESNGKAGGAKIPWASAIHSLMTYLNQHPAKAPGLLALCFFHLFSQETKKLSEGTLSNYRFSQPKPPVNATGEPRRNQGTTRAKTRAKILLYDQLLELFIQTESSDKDKDEKRLKKCREDAKFIFYHFTRYDRYQHYDLERFWSYDGPNIHFNYRENYRDGVDFFGNLLRFHINHCMPNRAEGLEPVLDPSHDKRNPPLALLTTFLLAEASSGVPAKERLSNRVQSLVNSNCGKEMLVQYENDYWTRSTRRHDLIRWVREHDLHIPREEILLFEENGWNPVTQNCGQYVLEYFLRDRMIQESREVLCQTAQSLFGNLFFGRFSYDAFSL